MDYEKLYKEALERASKYYNANTNKGYREIFEDIFHEFKESEDERIRKGIICGMNALKEQHKETFASIPINDCITWLEKQGEQKPVDESKPKFNVGDWVQIDGGHVMKILDVKKDALCYKILNWCGNESVRKISDIDSIAHLWTIQDAKYGDALQANKCTLIFDSLAKDVDGNTVISSWYFCDSKKFYGMGTSQSDLWSIEGVIPATKEQRDLLFQKMHEAGYEWDTEKKKLRKIEQKPSWSEEDEQNLQFWLDNNKSIDSDKRNWLKSLKDRVQPQPNYVEQDTEIHDLWVYIREWNDKFGRLPKDEDELAACIDYVMKRQKPAEWSKEDEDIINHLIKICSGAKNYNQFAGCSQNDITKYQNWLKSLKDRFQLQPKQEWNEGIKSRLDEISDFLQYKGREDDAEFIKSLESNYWKPIEVKNETKNKCPNYSEGYGCSTSPLKQCDTCPDYRLYNHWKPSEEQIKALHWVAEYGNITQSELLKSLYNDLKKL